MHRARSVRSRRWLVAAMVASSAALCGRPGVAAEKTAWTGLRVQQDQTTASITSQPGDGKVLEYRFAGVPCKPYVSQLCTLGGVPILRDSPADHKHHHALMFAVAVDGVDFWSETPSCGTQVHRKFDVRPAPAVPDSSPGWLTAKFTEQLDWLKPDKTPLAREERTIQACYRGDVGVPLVTWQTRLEPAPGKESIKLTGSHYFGLGMRLVVSMDKGGKFLTPDGQQGEVVRGGERMVPAAWCAYTASADGKPVTVAIFDHPRNPRHPARMFTMSGPFAYLSATMNLWKEPLSVPAGQPLVLRYGVAAWDGQLAVAKIDEVYQRWVTLGEDAQSPAKAR